MYGEGRLFACRTCHDLAYASQSEDFAGRKLLKAQRIRTKLNGNPSMFEPFPDKPKGMHWRTYWRLMYQAEEASIESSIAMCRRLGLERMS